MGNGGEQLASGRGNNALFVTRYLQDMKKSKEPFSMVFHQEEWSTYYFKKKTLAVRSVLSLSTLLREVLLPRIL